MDKTRKILFIKGTPAPSGYYRMGQIHQELQRLGYATDIIMYTEIDPVTLLGYKNTDGKLDAEPRPEDVIDLKSFHTVIFQMVWHEALNSVINQ